MNFKNYIFIQDRFFIVNIFEFYFKDGRNEFSGEILIYDGFNEYDDVLFSRNTSFIEKISLFLESATFFNFNEIIAATDRLCYNESCCICLEEFYPSRNQIKTGFESIFYKDENDGSTIILKCNHEFHISCFFKYLNDKIDYKKSLLYKIVTSFKNCPFCRQRIYIEI